jgi:hypothetical protein
MVHSSGAWKCLSEESPSQCTRLATDVVISRSLTMSAGVKQNVHHTSACTLEEPFCLVDRFCAFPTWARFESSGSGTQSDPAISSITDRDQDSFYSNSLTYNQHVRLLSSEPLVVCASKVYSGLGADTVYGIITLIRQGWALWPQENLERLF